MKTHRDLSVYKEALLLITDVYQATQDFPKSEIFGLTNQLRRSSVSIASNIAEGAARDSHKEFCQFLSIASGSAAELETQLIVSRNLNYLSQDKFDPMYKQLISIMKMIAGLKNSLKTKITNK